jgi:hypothetical protein
MVDKATECKYCTDDSGPILTQETISSTAWGWGAPDIKITRDEAAEINIGVIIDRGYLRLVDTDDAGCMDHGEKVKISYCPFCGRGLGGSDD